VFMALLNTHWLNCALDCGFGSSKRFAVAPPPMPVSVALGLKFTIDVIVTLVVRHVCTYKYILVELC